MPIVTRLRAKTPTGWRIFAVAPVSRMRTVSAMAQASHTPARDPGRVPPDRGALRPRSAGRAVAAPREPLAQRREQLRGLEDLRDQRVVEHDGVGDEAHGDGVVRQRVDLHLDAVAGAELALLEDLEVGAGARGLAEASDEGGILHPQPELEARQPGLDDLQQRRPDAPALAEQRARDVEPLDGEVLAERAGPQVAAELRLPRARLLDGVRVDRLVGTAVHGAVRLVVAVEVHAPPRDAAVDRVFPDGGADRAPAGGDGARAPDVDRQDAGELRDGAGHARRPRVAGLPPRRWARGFRA